MTWAEAAEPSGPVPAAASGADPALQARLLALYAGELSGLPDEAARDWLLRRVAGLEAALLALQAPAAMPEPEPPAPPGPVLLPCDEALPQGGFYPAEATGTGLPFRWIGPAPLATVFLPCLRLPAVVRLRVLFAFLPDMPDQVRLALDGGDWVSARRRPVPEGSGLAAVLEATLPPGPLPHGALMRLDIDTTRTVSPQARGGTDERFLSLALSSIEAESL